MNAEIQELIARYLYEELGLIRHDNRPLESYDRAEYSSLGSVQDAFFKSNSLARGIVDVLADRKYTIEREED